MAANKKPNEWKMFQLKFVCLLSVKRENRNLSHPCRFSNRFFFLCFCPIYARILSCWKKLRETAEVLEFPSKSMAPCTPLCGCWFVAAAAAVERHITCAYVCCNIHNFHSTAFTHRATDVFFPLSFSMSLASLALSLEANGMTGDAFHIGGGSFGK